MPRAAPSLRRIVENTLTFICQRPDARVQNLAARWYYRRLQSDTRRGEIHTHGEGFKSGSAHDSRRAPRAIIRRTVEQMNRPGIYIHIPFCRSRCSYCDFATGAYEGALAEEYVRALAREIESFELADSGEEVDTIYFGGGTPSLLTDAQAAHILDAVRKRFRVRADAEVTMEMNPGTVTGESARAFRSEGINRASFGAQTFDDAQLRRLGRTHTSDDTRRTFETLRDSGFDNVSFDLIAGLPRQTLDAWERNLSEALALEIGR